MVSREGTMNTLTIKEDIQSSLQGFRNGNLRDNARSLLNTLGYRSEKTLDLSSNDRETFLAEFDSQGRLNKERALFEQWRSIDLLFQLAADDISLSAQEQIAFHGGQVDDTIIESYLFFAIELSEPDYTRTQLAGITREINRLFAMPVMLVFRYGGSLTLSIINRRLHKRDESKDVLEKVTLIKDIAFDEPVRAHIDILYDLSLPALHAEFRFHNFVGLHKAWEQRLDTSQLNKLFYRDIANWYFWVLDHPDVIPPRDVKTDEQKSIFTIRLITRLIFCWFLQEKNLIPRDLFRPHTIRELLKDFSDEAGTYYKAILQNLFFATLNQEIPKRRFRSKNNSGGRDGNRGATTLFRYRPAFRDNTDFTKMLKRVPFINGGLFDCLDEVFRNREKKPNVRLDDFSEEKGNELCLPNELFFGAERQVDLSEVYQDKRKRKEKVRGIIEILNHYKFTVEENTPLEQEIALDPELLGKVFENLLASYNPDTRTTARKATGSFYTPREIVNYMVDKSLMTYLAGQLQTKGKKTQTENKLRQLFSASASEFENPFSHQQTKTLIEAIDNVKILDPACGSGAFPMGALHRLVDLLNKLDPNNRGWKEQQLERARQDRELAEQMQDEVNRENALKDIETRIKDIERSFDSKFHELDFARKLYLIENCIYGVDIQPIACQIAKLRFFIALIVDQKVDPTAPNLGVRPLPNLETKIVAADALIPVERPQLVLVDPRIQPLREKLASVRHEHFNARTPERKERCRKKDEELRQEIAKLLQQSGFPESSANNLAAWSPYDQNTHARFFDPEWMFGIADGFDIAIGNPPYVRLQTLKQQDPEYVKFLKAYFESASKGNFDLYVVFVERGLQLLGGKGNLSYILPHKFFNAKYGESLRALLARGMHLAHVVHFGDEQVFPGLTNYVCLLFLRKTGIESFRFVKVDDLNKWLMTYEATEGIVQADRVSASEWNFAVGATGKVLERLKETARVLGDVASRIFQGIIPGADKVYSVEVLRSQGKNYVNCWSRALDREVLLEESLLRPIISGADVSRFGFSVTGMSVLYPYEVTSGDAQLISPARLLKEYPKTYQYFEEVRPLLDRRDGGSAIGPEWYRYIRTQNIGLQTYPKIIVPRLVQKLKAAYDQDGTVCLDNVDVGGITVVAESDVKTKFLLALLNSAVVNFVFLNIAAPFRGGFYSANRQFIEPLPIAVSTPEQEAALVHLVDYLLLLNRQQAVVENPPENRRAVLRRNYFEQLLNSLVYELFFPEELHEQKLFLFRYVEEAKLPTLAEIPEAKRFPVLQETFERIYDLNHPIRSCLFSLRSLEVVRIIEDEA